MELQHFSHDHPLILSDENYSAFTELNECLCEICRAPLVGLCYCCHVCTYALHKWCADLPHHMEHELHPDHTLVLSQENPYDDCVCEECSKPISGFAFGCIECSFYIHTDCASLPERFTISLKEQKESFQELNTVEFNLTFRRKNKTSNKYGSCFVCSQPVSGSMFSCPEFPQIFFHIHCAMLPKTLKHERHVHDIDLAVNVTDHDPLCEEFYCDNCEEERDVTCGAYFCQKCKFVCHISCAIAGLDRPIQGILETKPIYLEARTLNHHLAVTICKPPEINIDNEHLKEQIRRDERRKEGEGTQLIHFSHEHPLVLYDENINTVYKCYACATSIFGKTYVCNNDCTFHLHKWCARLPQKILNPNMHPRYPLILTSKHMFNCRYCKRDLNAFSYCCKGCSFEIDVQCASIPRSLKCKGHEHRLRMILFLDQKEEVHTNENGVPEYFQSPSCEACGYPCEGISMGCVETACHYNIHVSCSLLPIIGKASTHMHNLTLCYSYKEDPDAFEFFCDACETTRTPGNWVYVCEEPKCNIVAHTDCVVPEVPENIYSVENQPELQDEPPAKNISVNMFRKFL